MCFQVYLGAYTACPEIPYAERADDRTRFPEASSIKLWVHKHPENSGYLGAIMGLTAPYQYALGILPCGCGFAHGHPPVPGAEYFAHRQLGDYLAMCLQHSQPVQLYSFWGNDSTGPIAYRRFITYDELYSTEFSFEERQLTLVYRDEESLHTAKAADGSTHER
jgi:hypothetical protein